MQVTDEEKEIQAKLPQIWDELVYKSKNTDAGLTVVKTKFTEVSSYWLYILKLWKFIFHYREESSSNEDLKEKGKIGTN